MFIDWYYMKLFKRKKKKRYIYLRVKMIKKKKKIFFTINESDRNKIIEYLMTDNTKKLPECE